MGAGLDFAGGFLGEGPRFLGDRVKRGFEGLRGRRQGRGIVVT